MKHRGRLHEVIRRAENGPMIEEKKFEKNLITQTVARLVKKYDIKFNQNTVVPDDDDLADRLYQAGLEFRLKLVCFVKIPAAGFYGRRRNMKTPFGIVHPRP